MLTWFLWGFFMGLGFAAAYGLVCGLKALAIGFHGRVKWPRAMPKRKGPTWEVMGLDFDPGLGVAERTALLNDYGLGGWELVSVTEHNAWLKRAL